MNRDIATIINKAAAPHRQNGSLFNIVHGRILIDLIT